MGTLAQLQARIASDLTRDDLTSQIADVVADAIKFYAKQKFWFNQSRNLSFNTVAAQSDYTTLGSVSAADIIELDALFVTQGSSVFGLTHFEPLQFEYLASPTANYSLPSAFTYVDQAIRLYPAPDAVYAMRAYAHYKLPYPADGDTNAWTDDAEDLIRSHAKMLLFLDVLQDDEGAMRMQNKIPVLLDFLRAETSKRTVNGRITPTDF